VTGIPTLWPTKIRTDALGAAARAEGIELICVEADYTRERGNGHPDAAAGQAAAPGDLGAERRAADGRPEEALRGT